MKSILQSQMDLECAIVQAPMAGGPTTPELLASVTEAGALGSFGFAYSTPDQIHSQCQAFRSLCADRNLASDCGWNANFFVFPDVLEPSSESVAAAVKQLEPLARRVSVDASAMTYDNRLPALREQVEAALAYKPSLISFHLGIPLPELVETIQAAGCSVAMSATSLAEAMLVQSAGADFIVAQGFEAGGHRGIFEPDASDDKLGISELVEVLTDNCGLPVIASGGIMHGRDIASIMRQGADAVQMGSAFLTVDECGSHATYRAAIDSFGERDTRLTPGFSGRPARGIRNLFIDSIDGVDDVLPFPLQNSLTGALRKAAGSSKDYELMSLWAGCNYNQARNCSAAQLIQELRQETAAALAV